MAERDRGRLKVFKKGKDFNDVKDLQEKINTLPPEYTKIAWIDNVVFTNPNWEQEVSDLLDRTEACQLFETVYTTKQGRLVYEDHSLAFNFVNQKKEAGCFEFAWAGRREWIEKFGLVDNLYMSQVFCDVSFNITPDQDSRYWMLKNKIRGKCGCVRGSIILQDEGYSPQKHNIISISQKRYSCDVVIPFCQNNIRWVKQSVESILNQVNSDPVIHLIADGFDMPNEFYSLPVHLYQNKERLGPYRTTNAVVPFLETEFMAIQDSDDIALPNRLSYSLNRMCGYDMYGGAMRQFTSYETKDEEADEYVLKCPIHTSMESGWSISPHGVVINGVRTMTKDLFVRMNGFADVFMSGDCEFTTRCYKYDADIIVDSEVLGLRRVHGSSLSRGKEFGLKSDIREELHNKIHETYKLMPDRPATEFGCLGKHETRRL